MNEITKYNDIHEKVIELKRNIETSFIKMGAYLKKIRDDKLYEQKGCITFEEYLGMPELSLSRSTVYAIINVYETYFIKSGQSDFSDNELIEIGYTKLNRISQFKDEPDFDEWIYKAKTLSLTDLSLEIKDTKEIKEKEAIIIEEVKEVVCPKCGYKFKLL